MPNPGLAISRRGKRFALSGELPAAQGAVVESALERLTAALPVMPDEDDRSYASARRADALVALCSQRIAADVDQDRATVVVHVQASNGVAEIEDGPPIHPASFDPLAARGAYPNGCRGRLR